MSFEAESPVFTGTVTVPDPTNLTDAASKGYVDGINARFRRGTQAMSNENTKAITFSPALPDADYTIALTPSVSVACWYTQKANTWFTIRTSAPITGGVDWIVVRG